MFGYGFGFVPPEPVMSCVETIDKNGFYTFHRGPALCCLTRTQFGFYWGHMGVKPGHPAYHRLFVISNGVRLYRVAMLDLGNSSQNKLWWLGFEGARPIVPESVQDELCRAVDGFELDKFK